MNNQALYHFQLLTRRCEPASSDLYRNIKLNPIWQFLVQAEDMEAIQMKFNRERT